MDGFTKDICNVEPVDAKWLAFGWDMQSIDGHNVEQIISAISQAKSVQSKPHIIIANTVKGKGVSFMENKPEWHARSIKEDEYLQALQDLQK